MNQFTASRTVDETHQEPAESQPVTELYTCTTCDETYIKSDMEQCPQCDEAVEKTPTFAELGLGPDSRT
ncbi:hypothetical protein B2G88_16415 [Natronolimnobius baerhuensis]|uniref:Rubrerythrin-like domain-containing protein n=1 Tax=Natronolimnobius baerhuensis TaxID=253108 RepID=A0A202E463_9EURY|nr:hypothetical protein B2G88_16415 [Natronolimnobius baerhuensis]